MTKASRELFTELFSEALQAAIREQKRKDGSLGRDLRPEVEAEFSNDNFNRRGNKGILRRV